MSELTREDELAALIAEQEADDKRDRVRETRVPHNMRPVSLDFTYESGTSASEIIGMDDRDLHGLIEEEAVRVRHIRRPQKWTRRGIVKVIRQWVAEHGELPGYGDWNYPNGRGVPSAASVVRHFGSWNDGMRTAGFEPRPSGGPRNPVQGTRLCRRVEKRHSNAFFTREQIVAAYTLYDRQRLSIPEIADRLWRQYGYSSPHTCRTALHRSFHQEGFRLRTKSEARMCLSPEKRQEIARRMAEGRWRKRTAA